MAADRRMQAFDRARMRLRSKGIEVRSAELVLFSMIWNGWAFGEAMRAHCRGTKGPRHMETEMDAAVRAAGYPSARWLLEEIYREVGICAD